MANEEADKFRKVLDAKINVKMAKIVLKNPFKQGFCGIN